MIQSPAGYQGDVRIKRYLDFYQPGYGVAMLSSGVAFSPLSLFAQGEQGGWYDPSDLTTMFQDAAGTTAAALESPVGLIRDKSGNGNHLSQSTSTARPVLSARVNLLTHSEQFDNAAWTKTNTNVSANTDIAPDGTLTADTISATSSFGLIGQSVTYLAGSYTLSVYAKKTGSSAVFGLAFSNVGAADEASVNLNTGAVASQGANVSSVTVTSAGDYWRIVAVSTRTASTVPVRFFSGYPTNINAVIWGADLRPANAGVGLPAYQRVGASTDYDATGFPYYLKFDGTDDSLSSGTISPGSVDKAQVFAGVRKEDTDDYHCLVEYGPDAAQTVGTLGIWAPWATVDAYGVLVRGTANPGVTSQPITYAAPLTNTISGQFDLSGASAADINTPRVNGVIDRDNLTGTSAGGNFTSQTLYIGRRVGSSFPLKGNIYSLIVRFSATNLDAATIASTETWVNNRTKAY